MGNPTGYTVETFTAGDGYRWQYRRYKPAGEPRAFVVCLHGIQSHAGWYERSCTELAAAGYEVFFLDRRGSGVNRQARGDAPHFRRMLDDVVEFLKAVRQGELFDAANPPLTPDPSPRVQGEGSNSSSHSPHNPKSRGEGAGATATPTPLKKVFLLAISWGGKIGASLPRRFPGLIDGLVFVTPGFCPRIRPTFLERFRVTVARVFRPSKLFPIPLSEPELFTANPRWIQFLREDPLALHRATARFLLESFRLDLYLYFVPRHLTMPVLLLLAGRDRIIDNDRTRAWVGRFAAADKTVVEYPEAHHTLEFEPDPSAYLADLRGWLDRHTPG